MDGPELRDLRQPMVRYQTQSLDTTDEAETYLFNLWRSWSLSNKASCLNHTTYHNRLTAWHFVQSQFSTLEKNQKISFFLKKVGVFPQPPSVPNLPQNLTMLVVNLKLHHLEDLIRAFSPRFYIRESAVKAAIEHQQSFNLIDNDTGWKIDIFVLASDLFHQNQFQRRQMLTVDEQNNTLWFSSPEDIILQKILWYHLPHKQSEQQWRDILGILKLQIDRLDIAYLDYWAHVLAVYPDLKKALTESGHNIP